MPGTTANKGWPYPVGTDPVVDGDNAIKAVADALDARVGAYVVVPTSVVGGTVNADGSITCNQSSGYVELRGVFTARYRFYRILYSISGSASTALTARTMIGTSQQLGASDYANSFMTVSGATVGAGTANQSFAYLSSPSAAAAHGEVLVFDPTAATSPTRLHSAGSGGTQYAAASSVRAAAVAEDGFAIGKTSGTTLGTVKVFGM